MNISKTNCDYSTPLTDFKKKDISSRLPGTNRKDEKITRINKSIQQRSKTTGQDLTLVFRIPHRLISRSFTEKLKFFSKKTYRLDLLHFVSLPRNTFECNVFEIKQKSNPSVIMT